MDTSDYPGEVPPNAVARVMNPALASAVASLGDLDLGIRIDSLLSSARVNDAVLAPLLANVDSILEPLQAQLANLATTAAHGLTLDLDLGLGLDLHEVMPRIALDDVWFARIADAAGLTIDESIHPNLIDAVNQAFAAVEDAGLLDEPATTAAQVPEARSALDDVDLGELGDAGRTFVAREGRGLSWEAKKRLFLWFVGATLMCALVQAMVTGEAAKELLEDGSTASTYVVLAVAAAGQGWDRTVPRPDDDGTGDGPDPEPGE